MTLPDSEDCSSDDPPPKRVKLEEPPLVDAVCESGLMSCCDDIILEILSYLKPNDLLAVSQCCLRLQQVVFDRTLWISVDLRPTCLSHSEIEKYIKYFLPSTHLIATIGPWTPSLPVPRRDWSEEYNYNREIEAPSTSKTIDASITGELLEKIKEAAPNLNTLILENHILDSGKLTWEQYPNTLEHLALRQCHVLNLHCGKSFFMGIDKRLPRLKVLDVSSCEWFGTHSFLALSKCNSLEELRLADCCIGDFVPYISLSTRFGFKNLAILDFRRTWVSDREISCLNKLPTLKELYLEAPRGYEGHLLITDLAVTSFGSSREQWTEMGYFLVIMAHYQEGLMPSPLRVIELCNYLKITDTTLRHCASCLKGLKLLTVKGTSCTRDGVAAFKSQRPDVEIVSDFNLEVDDSSKNVDNT